MSLPELRKLAKLHALDVSLREIRAKASQLDGGKRILDQIAKIKADHAETLETSHRLLGEQADLELQNKGVEAKIKKFEGDLYSGKVVNPREITAFEKEVEALKRQREKTDERLLELMELVPPAKEAAKLVEDVIAAKRAQLDEYLAKEAAAKVHLQSEFKKRTEIRPSVASQIEAGLLQKYETIRKANGGIGMSIVEKGRCGCGVQVPERTMNAVMDGRVMVCEGCHRIIHVSEVVL